MTWVVVEIDGMNHVKPIDDLRPHEGCGCWCHPLEDAGVIVHNSMDRREYVERGEAKTQ